MSRAPRLIPLAGDASTRRYFRYAGANGPRILCRYPSRAQLRRFVDANGLYRALGLPVPRLIEIREKSLEIVQGDLGDETLEAALAAGGRAAPRLLEEAVEFLRVLNPALAAPAYRLPQDLYRRGRFEMNFFRRWFVAERPGGVPASTLRAELSDLLARIDRLPPELSHRDYHRRNLMVVRRGRRPSLVIIDHQDTRRGPRGYDLASFLFDSYGVFPDATRRRLAARHGTDLDAPAFRLPALQRALKALGTFGYQRAAKKTRRYESAVPVTIGHARAHVEVLAANGIGFPALDRYLRGMR